jgi:hypothetical protein
LRIRIAPAITLSSEAAVRQTLGRCDVFGVVESDALTFDKLDEPFAVAAHVALHFSKRRKFFAFGLRDVEHIHAPETVQGSESLLRVGILFRTLSVILLALVTDHRSKNENAFFATPDEAAKRSPSAVSGNVGGVWLLRSTHTLPMF